MSKTPEELAARYGRSEMGNFWVSDTIGVPHPYCISAGHVGHASDRFSGMLGTAAIEDAEKHGIYCETCKEIKRRDNSKPILSLAEHEQALLVTCAIDMKDAEGKVAPELHADLLKCKPLAEEDKYAGFAFMRAK